jgi:hypothetical protein
MGRHVLFPVLSSTPNTLSIMDTKAELEHNDIERAHSIEGAQDKVVEERVELSEEDVSDSDSHPNIGPVAD